MKPEQTNQRSMKSQKGIISQKIKKAYVTELELVCDEVLEITSFYAKPTNIKSNTEKLSSYIMNDLRHYIFSLMKPFDEDFIVLQNSLKLHIFARFSFSYKTAKKLLNFQTHGQIEYGEI